MAKRPLQFVSPSSSPPKTLHPELGNSPAKAKKQCAVGTSPAKAKQQCVYPKYKDISSLEEPIPHNVHGVLASLSPLKPSKYFEGELTDGNECMRMVGFDKLQ